MKINYISMNYFFFDFKILNSKNEKKSKKKTKNKNEGENNFN